MKGDFTFGIDLGSESLKTGFVYEYEREKFKYGKLATSFFDDRFPACGYCTPDTDEWIFGEDIYQENKDYERIVRIKDLLKLYDGTEDCAYFKKDYEYPKFRPNFIEESRTRFDKSSTFRSRYSPKEVAEQFFRAYFKLYFTLALTKLRDRFPETDYNKLIGSNAILAIPDNARDEYAAELVRLVNTGGFLSVKDKGFKTRRVSETAALYAVQEKKLAEGERALVADVGETGLTLSVVEGIDLEEYRAVWAVGGRDFDRDVFEYVKREIDKKRGSKEESYGTYYQLFNLELRIKDAKATLSTAGSQRTRVEVEGATTELVPLPINEFLGASFKTTKRVSDLITVAAREAKIKKIILSGGASLTRGLLTAVREANPGREVVLYDAGEKARAEDIFDVYDGGTEFAPAVGAALFATKRFKSVPRAPLSYGVRTVDGAGAPICSIIIYKNDKLPKKDFRKFYTRGIVQNIETSVYATNEMKDLPLIDKDTTAQYIKDGLLVEKDKGCQAWFGRTVELGYPVLIEIGIDQDGVGEVHAYDGVTKRKLDWRGKKFSTESDRGGA